MISIKQDALLLNLIGASQARYLPRSDDRRTWGMLDRSLALELGRRAERAKSIPIAPLPATQYGADTYIKAYVSRTEALKALVLGTCCQGSDSFARPMIDLIYAICSQPDWSLVPCDDGVADYTNTTIDVYSCETGALLALTGVMCGNILSNVSPKAVNLISHTLKARLLDPLINWEGVDWRISGEHEARAIAALITASLTGETDDRRRWLCLRRALSLLDSFIKKLPENGGFTSGLENHAETCLALDDCFTLLSLATAGAVELRDEKQFVEMAKAIVDCHIDGGWFLNPNGFPAPKFDADALFRLGSDARLNPLCELAAYIRRQNGGDKEYPRDMTTPTASLYQLIMSGFCRTDISRRSARIEKPERVVKSDMLLLASRMGGFYAGLTGCACPGPYKPAVGDFALYVSDEPAIITYPSRESRMASVPTIGGADQISVSAKDLDCQDGAGYSMLSMNIAPAYPGKAGVISWQRTLMIIDFEQSLRLMDVFDLEGKQTVAFRFIFAEQPRVGAGEVGFGEASMQFDPDLSVRVEKIATDAGGFVHRLELYTPESVSGGNYSFVFRLKAGSR